MTADQIAKSNKKSNKINRKDGELVVLRTKNGDKQTFLKRTKNLLWHCAPIQPRQQSATSHTKRASYAAKAANSSVYGA